MRRLLEANDGSYAIFFALYEYHPLEVSTRLVAITRDPIESAENEDKALHLQIAFSLDSAARCLVDCGGSFPLSLLLSTLAKLAASEKGKPLLLAALDDFAHHHDERQLAATLCSPRQDTEDRKLQFHWITEQLANCVNGGTQAKMPRRFRDVAQQLCRPDHPKNLRAIHSHAISATAPVPCVDILLPLVPQKALTKDRVARRVVRKFWRVFGR